MPTPARSSLVSALLSFRWVFWLSAVVLLAGMVRTYRLDSTLADWHSFRQVDTAAVTREFVRSGIDLLHPRYHDVSNIQSGKLNLEGWRMVEFPLMNAVTAWILLLHPSWPLVPVSRVVSIVSFLIALAAWGELVRRWYGHSVAVVTTFLMAVLPYSVYFTRVVLPEPFLLPWVAVSALAFSIWVEQRNRGKAVVWWQADLWLMLALVCFAVALLVKPMAVFWLPAIGVAFVRRDQWLWTDWARVVIVFGVSVIPVLLWRDWIQQFPSGIPASDWLFNGNGIRFKPAWWRWLFGDRFGRLWFGHYGAGLIPIGIAAALPATLPARSKSWMKQGTLAWDWFWQWLAQEGLVWASVMGTLGFLVVFATGNVQHDYYQTILIPLVTLVWARGAVWLVRLAPTTVQRFGMATALSVVVVFGLAFAWYDIKGNFNVNNPAIELAGRAVQAHTPEDALVIANYSGDTTLLFATERHGWPIGFSIDEKRSQGAAFYITTAKDDEANELQRLYPTVEETKEYLLLDLRVPLSTGSAVISE